MVIVWKNPPVQFCYVMLIGIILAIICLFIGWLLLSPFSIKADTRVPYVSFHWKTIGSAVLNYENSLLLHIQILFYHKTIDVLSIQPKKKKASGIKKRNKRKMSFTKIKRKGLNVFRSFRVKEWELAVDTGDHTLNAKLYPANFHPRCYHHLQVNFIGENYLYFDIRNRPWKLLYAWLK